MHVDFSWLNRRRLVWVVIAAVAGLFGLLMLCLNTGPKLMSAGPDAGASPLDLLGVWGPIITAVIALVKGVWTRDPSEVVDALKALAADPKSLELLRRAEIAILDRLRINHKDDPKVLNAISALAMEISVVNFPPADPTPKGE